MAIIGNVTVDGFVVGSIDVVVGPEAAHAPDGADIGDDAGSQLASLGMPSGSAGTAAGASSEQAAAEPRQRGAARHSPFRRAMGPPREPGAARHSPYRHATGDRAAVSRRLIDARRSFGAELQDQATRERLMRLTEAEVGGQGPKAAQAFQESVMNRAAARGQTLAEAMASPYYPEASRRGKEPTAREMYGETLDKVLAGSNLANLATGNASGSVGFGGGPQTYAPGTGERFGVEARDLPWAERMAGAEGPSLEAASGRRPNLALVDARLKEIVGAGARHLPPGYRVVVTEGFNARGHAPGSQHHVAGRGALDVKIIDPAGNAIPNRGRDTTGLYTRLARASYGEMLARHPELKGHFAWGGSFGTSRGSGIPDLMHFDLGGERGRLAPHLSQMGALPDRAYGDRQDTAAKD